uniref:Venom polypeptide n=1 Tax=Dolopus genitalis TaxID=2488630 RepID=A0A3G5BIB3_DOLGE|nr:venom polypeptide [Dolopus genitalis]
MKFLLVSFAIVLMILGLTSGYDDHDPCFLKCKFWRSISRICVKTEDGTEKTLINESVLLCAKGCNRNWTLLHHGACPSDPGGF